MNMGGVVILMVSIVAKHYRQVHRRTHVAAIAH
jgi:hypothetical protein